MSELKTSFYSSPIGIIKICANDIGITSVIFTENVGETSSLNYHIENCIVQLDEYFKGERKEFSMDLLLSGTDFQKRVWTELRKIPYGITLSYIRLAKRLGDKNSLRAVGGANNKNPIAIIIPCHRVIGEDGSLIGYGGGLWRKKWLLKHEQTFYEYSGKQLSLF